MTIQIAPGDRNTSRNSLMVVLGLMCAFFGSSCVHHSLTQQALSFNKTIHDHRVEQLLLNVLRASNREPMALTAVTSLSTNNSRRLNVGPVAGAFGRQAADLYTGAISGGVSASPNMALTILDDDPEFMEGFLKPVPESTVRYFVEQGWNTRLLAFLLIEEIRDSRAGNLVNDPRNPEEFALFETVLNENLQHLAVIEERRTQVPRRVTTTSIQISENEERTEVITNEASDAVVQRGGLFIEGSDAVLVMRSPQSVLYYLGELTRIQLSGDVHGVIPEVVSGGVSEPLFLVERLGEGKGTSKHSVNYHGCQYRIPDRPSSRSLQCLSFVQQLINLQSKTIAPAPSTLRLIGP